MHEMNFWWPITDIVIFRYEALFAITLSFLGRYIGTSEAKVHGAHKKLNPGLFLQSFRKRRSCLLILESKHKQNVSGLLKKCTKNRIDQFVLTLNTNHLNGDFHARWSFSVIWILLEKIAIVILLILRENLIAANSL